MNQSFVRYTGAVLFLLCCGWSSPTARGQLPTVEGVPAQPLKANVKRVVQTMDYLGEPLTDEVQSRLDAALREIDDAVSVKDIQQVMDSLVLVRVNINPESRVKISAGDANPRLTEQGWTVFLVKVENEAGITAPLNVTSPNAAPIYKRSTGRPDPELSIQPEAVQDRWMDVRPYVDLPLRKPLSGLELEYRIIQIYSRDRGKREASLAFDVGQGTQDVGFRSLLPILFDSVPAVEVQLEVVDDDGTPTMGQFVFRDPQGRVYPSRARRLEPDFFFHDQVYRRDGESILLPAGEYDVTYTRGPEYRVLTRKIRVPEAETHRETFRLNRWIHLAQTGWYSGDHHVHAAGCSHYESPTQGVDPESMMRHVEGEDLNVGCVLSWGPCWYFQKRYFEGALSELSQPRHLMRYDVEVSGFPSQHAGHLCLLRLKEDDYRYPDPVEFDWSFAGEKGRFAGTQTEKIGQWPTWDLPILDWGKRQGGVVGFSHSGWGLELPDVMPNGSRQFRGRRDNQWQGKAASTLPDDAMPRFDGIGANEYIVDVTHDVCDFISAVDTPAIWELNIWYHTLNCGYTCRISGETDFPCIYDDRVGLGRSYVKLDSDLSFDSWVDGIRAGRSYVSDGLSHLYDFEINGVAVGTPDDRGRESFLSVASGSKLSVEVTAAAYLAKEPREDIRARRLDDKPYWHVERARINDSNKVPVELIVNGESVETQELVADGRPARLQFDFVPEQSSWIALRVLPSSHTNPIFVEVDGKPIRASRKSAQWCLQAVDQCWKQKEPRIRAEEKAAAAEAYEFARDAYRRIADESPQ